ncbi:hypothetical protein ACIOG4_35735 [Streptomyces microflavus]|uniref:hypothetical protein n=1 Tax=Streptomyces microflavus TaxID=1919 RepID=UPI0038238A8E
MAEHFSIGAPVDFVDVHVDRDNRLYVDPSAIRFWAKNGNAWAGEAYASICEFFDKFLERILSSSASENRSAREMLWQFHEPWETRLGMSAVGFSGSGASEELGDAIWDSLQSNPLCTLRVPILKRLEDIPLFVPKIADDRVSDLTTRLIFRDLAKFTRAQMELHPSLNSLASDSEFQVWDAGSGSWSKETINLPHVKIDGDSERRPLLLVPKIAVHRNLRMGPSKYWEVEILGSIQGDLTAYIGGKAVAPSKKDLKGRDEYRHKRSLNVKRTHEIWTRDNFNLLEAYRERVDSKYEPLSDDEIEQKLG